MVVEWKGRKMSGHKLYQVKALLAIQGSKQIQVILSDNDTSKNFVKYLPLKLYFQNYQNDLCTCLPEQLGVKKEDLQNGWQNGDLIYAKNGKCIAFCHSGQDQSQNYHDLIVLGKVTDLTKLDLFETGMIQLTLQKRSKKMKYADKDIFDKVNAFGLGSPNDAYTQFFIGQSFLNGLGSTEDGQIQLHNVTFEPGCRNNWHIHSADIGGGQVLICTAGEGWYQEDGKPAQSLSEGDVVVIPANLKHWHGAKADSWFSHVAFGVPGENTSNVWLEEVTDEEFSKLVD